LTDRLFLDTNVLVYADDALAGPKQAIAQEVVERALEAGAAVFSTQVLGEYFVVATRKLGLDAAAARRRVEILSSFDVVQVDVPTILHAIDLHRLHAIAFWDALIVYSAAVAGCARLITEDLQHGRTYEGVKVENPFRGA
jgi:predicted nucleic acid-binding protein